MPELPSRKPNRLQGHDYSQNGLYFITMCVRGKQCVFWDAVGARIARPILSNYGLVVEQAINKISFVYNNVCVDKYVIMPNHIHLLLNIQTFSENGRAMRAPTVSTVVNQMKGFVTKQIGHSIWQKLFHDRIVRDEAEYVKIWQYIENNPLQWELDCFYTKP